MCTSEGICDKCGGDFYIDGNGYLCCDTCGREINPVTDVVEVEGDISE